MWVHSQSAIEAQRKVKNTRDNMGLMEAIRFYQKGDGNVRISNQYLPFCHSLGS